MRGLEQIPNQAGKSFFSFPLQAWINHLQGWKAACTWAVLLATSMRLVLGGFMAVFLSLTRNTSGIQPLLDFSSSIIFDKVFWYDFFIGAWVRWDAVNYIKIAQQGYAGLPPPFSIFYPLFPTMTRWTAGLLGKQYELAGLIISTVCTIVALALLYKTVEDEFGALPARWTVIALSSFPTAFFLLAPFTESLFLALTLGAFYLARRNRWVWVGILGACASLTRGPGIYTSAALAWLAWKQYRDGRLDSLINKASVMIGLTLPVIGGLSFLIWRTWAGYAPVNVILLDHFKIELINPFSALWFELRQMAIKPLYSTWLDGISAFIGLCLLAVMLIKPRWRRGEWILYMGLNLGVFLSKHYLGEQASPIQSIARYSLVLFPGFIIVGEWLSRQRKRYQFCYLSVNQILLLLSAGIFSINYFIG